MVKDSDKNKDPRCWPAQVKYVQHYVFHSSVPDTVRAFVKGDECHTQIVKKRPLATICKITSSAHPANGQYGLFASKKIQPNTHIIDYLGELHCDERLESDYDLSLHRFQGDPSRNIGIDAKKIGNEARFINDYRGITPRPNAVFRDARAADNGELRMGIWSNTVIKKGDEILVSYGKPWWRARSVAQIDMEKSIP